MCSGLAVSAQTATESDTTAVSSEELPPIDYGLPREYTIQEIKVVGAESYDDFVLIGFSGLSVGQKITIPGGEITEAVKKFWQQLSFHNHFRQSVQETPLLLHQGQYDGCFLFPLPDIQKIHLQTG